MFDRAEDFCCRPASLAAGESDRETSREEVTDETRELVLGAGGGWRECFVEECLSLVEVFGRGGRKGWAPLRRLVVVVLVLELCCASERLLLRVIGRCA